MQDLILSLESIQIDLMFYVAFLIALFYFFTISGVFMKLNINSLTFIYFSLKPFWFLGLSGVLLLLGGYFIDYRGGQLELFPHYLIIAIYIFVIIWRIFGFAGIFQAIDNPEFISAEEAEKDKSIKGYLEIDGVIGVDFDSEARAYPIEVISMAHVVNDVIGDKKIAVTHCNICNSSHIYDRVVDGKEYVFFTAPYTYNSNNLLVGKGSGFPFWQELTGIGLRGEAKGTTLKQLDVQVTSWSNWKRKYPNTKVLKYKFKWRQLIGYKAIWKFLNRMIKDSEGMPFPTKYIDEKFPLKEEILGVIGKDDSIAIPVNKFEDSVNLNTTIGREKVFIFWDKETKEFGAFLTPENDDLNMVKNGNSITIVSSDGSSIWNTFGEMIQGGKDNLVRVKHTYPVYWFAWANTYRNTKIIDSSPT